MTITKIQNPYKMPQMQAFTYNKSEQKSDNNTSGVSKGLGVVAPPIKKIAAEPKSQDVLELKRDVRSAIDNKIEQNQKSNLSADDIPTPLGVKLIAGLGCAAVIALMIKKHVGKAVPKA